MNRWSSLLPTSLEVNGNEYEIRSDYRDVREIMIALNDVELSDTERAEVVLTIFYPTFDEMPIDDYQEALNKLMWFINCGKEEKQDGKKPVKLIDWDKDFTVMVSPINHVLGKEIRALDYLHWWTYKAAWDEISPDCLFAKVIKIRSKLAKNKPLDTSEKSWYRENRDLIDMTPQYTQQEKDIFALWGGTPKKED